MKKFLITLSIFSAIFFLVDKIFVVVRNASPALEADKRLERILTGNINADILIYGSSRGARNVIAKQIEDSLGQTVFNLSYPGSNVEFHDYLLQQTLKYNRKPKTIVLVVDGPWELLDNPTTKFRFDRLFPLVKYEAVRNTLVEKDMKNRVLMNLFILHQLNLDNFLLYPKRFSALDTVFADGSMPIQAQSRVAPPRYSNAVLPYVVSQERPELLAAYRSFIDSCHRQGIRLVLSFPPDFSPPNASANQRLESLAGSGAEFMTYDSTQAAYRNPAYWYDNAHLTRQGAIIFTNELSRFLKNRQ